MKAMNIVYLCSSRYLSVHFLKGWRNALVALGHNVKHLDYTRESTIEYFSKNTVDLVFAYSDEGLLTLPLDRVNKKEIPVIIGALPYNSSRTTFDPHTPLMRGDEFDFITKLKRKLVWSQHQPTYNREFYSSYLNQGIEVVFLPHCADTTSFQPENIVEEHPLKYDLFFVGSLGHKKPGNTKLLKQVFSLVEKDRVLIYGDQEWKKSFGIDTDLSPENLDLVQAYSSAVIAPNIHSFRQKKHGVLLNDRTFHIPVYGGFQICDNPLVKEYFNEDEMVYGVDDSDFVDKFRYFLTNKEERIPYIQKAGKRVYEDHSYFNRIARLWESLEINEDVIYKGNVFKPYYSNEIPESLTRSQRAYFFLETRIYSTARKCKKIIQSQK